MKIKDGFVIEKVADSYLACATGELASSFSGFIRLNSTGAFLWQQLSGADKSVDELAEALMKEYDVSSQKAREDIAAFVKILSDSGILQ